MAVPLTSQSGLSAGVSLNHEHADAPDLRAVRTIPRRWNETRAPQRRAHRLASAKTSPFKRPTQASVSSLGLCKGTSAWQRSDRIGIQVIFRYLAGTRRQLS